MIEYIITHMSDNFRLHFSNYKGEREKCTLKAKFLHTICLWKGLDMKKTAFLSCFKNTEN